MELNCGPLMNKSLNTQFPIENDGSCGIAASREDVIGDNQRFSGQLSAAGVERLRHQGCLSEVKEVFSERAAVCHRWQQRTVSSAVQRRNSQLVFGRCRRVVIDGDVDDVLPIGKKHRPPVARVSAFDKGRHFRRFAAGRRDLEQ